MLLILLVSKLLHNAANLDCLRIGPLLPLRNRCHQLFTS